VAGLFVLRTPPRLRVFVLLWMLIFFYPFFITVQKKDKRERVRSVAFSCKIRVVVVVRHIVVGHDDCVYVGA